MKDFIKNTFGDVNFDINLYLHSLILFSFLSIFFIFYITKLVKSVFNDEISHLIEESLSDKIKEIKKNSSISYAIDQLPLDVLIKAYSGQDKAVEMHNQGLFNTVFFINALLWVGLIVVVLILKMTCNTDIHIKEIVMENAIIFSFIGVIEFMFFKYIAFKFVPVEPSFISKQFLETVKQELNKSDL